MLRNSLVRGVDHTRKLVSLLGIGQIISWGTLYYAYPLIAEAMAQELTLTKSQIYGTASIGLFLSACAAYPVGRAIDCGHGRDLMIVGSLCAGLLMILWGLSSTWLLIFGIVLLLGIVQSMTLYDTAFGFLAKSVSAGKLSHSITTLTLWGGFASTVFVPLTEFSIQNLGWRNALTILGVLNLFVAAIYFVIPSVNRLESVANREGLQVASQYHSMRMLLASPVLWSLVVSFTLYSLVFSGLSFHLYPIYSGRELSSSTIATGIAILGPAQVSGRVLIWRISKRVSIANAGRYILLAFPVALIAMIHLNPLASLIVFMSIYGIANGIMTIVRGTAVSEMLSTDSYGSNNSLISIPSTICKALGPFALAYGFQRTGGYDFPIQMILFLTILIGISYWYATVKAMRIYPGKEAFHS